MLCFQLCSHYTALQMKNSTGSVSAVNPVATENTGNTATRKPHHSVTNQHLVLSVKRTETQDIKPVALSIVELYLAEASVSQSVSVKFC